jgi:TnpA family transposase
VFYGRRGQINARELWEQMNTCSCVTLILARIVYWQAREISWVLHQVRPGRRAGSFPRTNQAAVSVARATFRRLG